MDLINRHGFALLGFHRAEEEEEDVMALYDTAEGGGGLEEFFLFDLEREGKGRRMVCCVVFAEGGREWRGVDGYTYRLI